jgi:uncharacterized protein (UPF0335 family)
VVSAAKEAVANTDQLNETIEKIENVLEEHPSLSDEINALNLQLKSVQESHSKTSALLKGVMERKGEIDELYYEIIGYEEENEETGKSEKVEGLKSKLENQYNDLLKG